MRTTSIFESVEFLDNSILNEKTGGFKTLKKIDNSDVPKDFKKIAIEVAKELKEKSKVVKGGPNSEFVDLFKSKKNPEKRIEESSPKNSYVISLLKVDPHLLAQTVSKRAKELADDVLIKCGFKKGNKILWGIFSTNYYYIKKDKEIYVAYLMSYNDGIASNYSMYIQCLENNEKMQKEIISD